MTTETWKVTWSRERATSKYLRNFRGKKKMRKQHIKKNMLNSPRTKMSLTHKLLRRWNNKACLLKRWVKWKRKIKYLKNNWIFWWSKTLHLSKRRNLMMRLKRRWRWMCNYLLASLKSGRSQWMKTRRRLNRRWGRETYLIKKLFRKKKKKETKWVPFKLLIMNWRNCKTKSKDTREKHKSYRSWYSN